MGAPGGNARVGAAGHDDSGASTLELAILTPIFILTLAVCVQFAMVFHARHVALAAVQEGARVARTDTSANWEARSKARADAYYKHIGGRLLETANFTTITAGVDQRGVEVSATAVNVLPFLTFTVVERSIGPVECFRPDTGSIACGP